MTVIRGTTVFLSIASALWGAAGDDPWYEENALENKVDLLVKDYRHRIERLELRMLELESSVARLTCENELLRRDLQAACAALQAVAQAEAPAPFAVEPVNAIELDGEAVARAWSAARELADDLWRRVDVNLLEEALALGARWRARATAFVARAAARAREAAIVEAAGVAPALDARSDLEGSVLSSAYAEAQDLAAREPCAPADPAPVEDRGSAAWPEPAVTAEPPPPAPPEPLEAVEPPSEEPAEASPYACPEEAYPYESWYAPAPEDDAPAEPAPPPEPSPYSYPELLRRPNAL
jgi:hypothetical protein